MSCNRMIKILKSEERGKTKLAWLDGKHSFSFGRYVNRERQNFGKLIVFNDDIISPAKGFGAHPHENAEIVTIVLKGKVKHKDSVGNEGVISEGETQRISAGKGVWHSEFNGSDSDDLHLLQIWLLPREEDTEVSYEQKTYGDKLRENKLFKIVSGKKEKDMIYINQDADFHIGKFDEGKGEKFRIAKDKGVYFFVISGRVRLEKENLEKGDSAEIEDLKEIEFSFLEEGKVLIIETAM